MCRLSRCATLTVRRFSPGGFQVAQLREHFVNATRMQKISIPDSVAQASWPCLFSTEAEVEGCGCLTDAQASNQVIELRPGQTYQMTRSWPNESCRKIHDMS